MVSAFPALNLKRCSKKAKIPQNPMPKIIKLNKKASGHPVTMAARSANVPPPAANAANKGYHVSVSESL